MLSNNYNAFALQRKDIGEEKISLKYAIIIQIEANYEDKKDIFDFSGGGRAVIVCVGENGK